MRSTLATQLIPRGWNSRMRLKEAMVAMDTQCSSSVVWSVHMNLYGALCFRPTFDFVIMWGNNALVIWEIGIGKVEFDYR